MQIEIPDDIMERLRQRSDGLPDQVVGELALAMMQVGLEYSEFKNDTRDRSPVDELTGCLTYKQLRDHLKDLFFGAGWDDRTACTCQFLCLNIRQFKHYNDQHGMERGNEALAEIGNQLVSSNLKVYRAGGEKFLLMFEGDEVPSVPHLEELEFRQSVVRISLQRDPAHYHHFVDGILWYCDKGLRFGEVGSARLFMYDSLS
jgi:GGDEF domain-containing protein